MDEMFPRVPKFAYTLIDLYNNIWKRRLKDRTEQQTNRKKIVKWKFVWD